MQNQHLSFEEFKALFQDSFDSQEELLREYNSFLLIFEQLDQAPVPDLSSREKANIFRLSWQGQPQESSLILTWLGLFRQPAVTFALGIVIGCILVLAVTNDHIDLPQTLSPQASKQPASLEERTEHCLQKSKVLLLALANFDPQTDDATTLNLPYQRRISEALVQEASYLKSELSDPAERRLQDLIGDLEVILLQIANLEDEYDIEAVEMLRSGVNKRGILFRIDLSQMSTRMQDAFQDEIPKAKNSSQI